MWHLLKKDPSLRPLGSKRGWVSFLSAAGGMVERDFEC